MNRSFLITGDSINSRLDRWLKRNISPIPQSLIEKNLRKGKIKVNDKKIKSSYRLQKNDKINFYNFTFKARLEKKKKFIYDPSKKDLLFSSKIFIENNENFAVINKPAGISVQSGTKSKKNILDIIRKTHEFKDASPYAVHRIDKETTGILIVAKNRKYAQLLTTLFRIRKIHKTYLCIVLGEFKEKKGKLVDILFSYEGNKKIESKAITRFKVIDSNNHYSLLELYPETGRKHQLRKQLLIHGYPVLGDSKYRISEKTKIKDNNLMLHAHKISFSIDNIKYNFLAELPPNFKDTIKEKYLKSFSL
tara:strand:+ start:431 stop:1348 length:918 start_codon:yes stop_codon:yes gene_type:complete